MTLPTPRPDRRRRQAEKARSLFSRHARVKPQLNLERLEERVVLSVIDYSGGLVTYLAASGVNNDVTLSYDVGTNTDTLTDTGDTISLTANAIAAGVTLDASHHVATVLDIVVLAFQMNTGDGSDVFHIQSIVDPVTISPTNNSGGTQFVFLGVSGMGVQAIQSNVTINNAFGTSSVEADDSSNTTTARNVTVSGSSITGLLGNGSIFVGSGALLHGNLTIQGGTQANTFTYTGTPSPGDTLNGGSNAADQTIVKQLNANSVLSVTSPGTVTVGNSGNTSNVLGTVNVTGDPTSTSLNIDDSSDNTAHTYNLSTATNLGMTTGTTAGISSTGSVTYTSINSYNLRGSNGNDVFNISNTMPGIVNNIYTRTGINIVNLLGTATGSTVNVDALQGSSFANLGNSGLTSGLLGTLNFTDSSGGTFNITVDDSSDSNARTVGITSTAGALAISGLTSSSINAVSGSISGLLVKGGNGGNAFTITNNGSNSYATSLTSGSGNDTFAFSNGASLNSGTIDGGAGSDTLDYSAYNAFVTVNLNASPQIATATGSVSNIENVKVGNFGSTQTAPAGVASNLTGGSGNDTFLIPANAGNVTVNGNGGTDDLQLFGAGVGGDSFSMVGANTGANPSVTTITGSSPTHTVTSNSINTVEINGGTDNTTATVDFSAGNPIPAGGITYTGGGGSSNTLILKNDFSTPSFVNEIYNATSAGAGYINLFNSLANVATINFSGLSPVIDSTTVTNYTFNAPAAINNIAITSATVNGFAGSLIASTDTPPTFESAAIANKTNVTLNSQTATDTAVTVNDPGTTVGLATLTINTGNGNDFVNLINTPAGVITSVNTGSGTDGFNVNAAGLGGSTTVDGSTASNNLIYDAGNKTTANNVVSSIQGTLTSGAFPTLTYRNFTSIVINNIKDLPMSNTPAALTIQEGKLFSDVVGSFAFSNSNPVANQVNPIANSGDFTGSINWGDGSPTTAGTIVSNGTGGWNVLGTHTYASVSTPTISVSVTHKSSISTSTTNGIITSLQTNGGSTTTITSSAAVSDAPLTATGSPIVATEGPAGAVPAGTLLATFNDSNPLSISSDFSATVDWGDGTVVALPGGSITVLNVAGTYKIVSGAAHTYAEEGLYTVKVNIHDVGGSGAIATSTANVNDAALTATGTPVSSTDGNSFSGQVATFTDADSGGVIGDYTVAINWGDGVSTPGTLTQPGGAGTQFVVSGTHTWATGSYPITVSIKDSGGASATATSTATVSSASLTPGVGASLSVVEGQAFSAQLGVFTTGNPKAVSSQFAASVNWGDGLTSTGIVTQSANGSFSVSGSHTYAEESSNRAITITVTDLTGPVATINGSAVVADAPLSSSGVNLIGVEGAAIPAGTLVASFSDADPAGTVGDYTATINWGDGTTSAGTISAAGGLVSGFLVSSATFHVYAEEGAYTVRVTINDAGGSSTVATSTSTISDAALAVTGVSVSATEGNSFTGQVATFTDADPAGAAADYTVAINWGDGIITPGILSQPGGGGSPFVVVGTHTYKVGTFPITISVKDAGGSQASGATTATVTGAALAHGNNLTLSGIESVGLTNYVGTFTSANPLATPGDFAATINWGDSSPVSIGTVLLAADGTFYVSGGHTYAEESGGTPYTVTVTVKSNSGITATLNATATIVDAPLASTGVNVIGVEGAAIPAGTMVATLTDADTAGTAGDYTATIFWGDGTNSAANIIAAGGQVSGFNVLSATPHTYAEEGAYNVRVVITDAGGSSTTSAGQASITDAALSATGTNVAPIEGNAFTAQVATFTDADPVGVTADYTVSINWGDGIVTPGTVSQPGGIGTSFVVTGSHTYKFGSFPITVSLKDAGGATATSTSTATVAGATLTPGTNAALKGTESTALSDYVGTFTSANPLAYSGDLTASIDWGDGTSVSIGSIGQAPNGTFYVTGGHTYTEESTTPYAVTVTVKSTSGITATLNATAAIKDAPLSGSGSTVQGTEGLGLSQTGSSTFGSVVIGTFTDTDPAGVIADYTTAPGSIVVNWGDGSALQTLTAANLTAVGSPNGVVFTISAPHIYAETGTYQIVTTVTDTGGAAVVLSGTAQIADAPLGAATVQPTVNVVEQTLFSLPIVAFNDANPTATLADYKAIIDWGDGTPTTFGSISQTLPATTFVVSGSHIYANSGVDAPAIGHYTITVHVIDKEGATVTLINTTNVTDPPIALAGYLNPASDSGFSNSDNITKVKTPSFLGNSEPFSQISLVAMPQNGGAAIYLGTATTTEAGTWSLTSGVTLADGKYTVVATAKDQYGHVEATTPASPVVITPILTIDTIGPVVSHVYFDRVYGRIDVTYTDNLGGVFDPTIVDASNYSFSKVHIAKQKRVPYLITSATVAPGGNSTTETVVLTINNGKYIRGGYYNFLIHSESAIMKSGVQDVAGNALDGEFYSYFPSGNHINGGDFAARLDAIHNIIYSPGTIVGTATPNVPVGTPEPIVHIPTVIGHKSVATPVAQPAKVVKLAKATPNSVAIPHHLHDLALEHVTTSKVKRK